MIGLKMHLKKYGVKVWTAYIRFSAEARDKRLWRKKQMLHKGQGDIFEQMKDSQLLSHNYAPPDHMVCICV
jgi:hypothetical protein